MALPTTDTNLPSSSSSSPGNQSNPFPNLWENFGLDFSEFTFEGWTNWFDSENNILNPEPPSWEDPGHQFQSQSHETTMTGNLDYEKIHPPTPDMSGISDIDLQQTVANASDVGGAIGSLGNYWANTLGADPINEAEFTDQFGNKFDTDVIGWADDWGGFPNTGGDPTWQHGNVSPEDWKKHGGKRAMGPDLEFLTTAETKFKTLETAIGYNSDTDLIEDVFPGYGAGDLDTDVLRTRGDSPEIVIGTKNTDTGKLEGGELVRSDNASGAWGDYLLKEGQVEETASADIEDAKDLRDAEFKSIRAQRKSLGQGGESSLRGIAGERSLSGLRRGGRRAGRFGRGDVQALQAQSKQLGSLREKARSDYNRKLEKIALTKKQDIEVAANTLQTKVETEFTELAGDLDIAENTYQSDSLQLEEDRIGTIFDIFQVAESSDPAPPWPADPAKEKCFNEFNVEIPC